LLLHSSVVISAYHDELQHPLPSSPPRRSSDLYADRSGASDFLVFDTGDTAPEAPHRSRVGLAWLGDAMIELIEPVGEPPELYRTDRKSTRLNSSHVKNS